MRTLGDGQMPNCNLGHHTARQGFALPAVLTVVGVVTLIFLVAITALQGLNHEARLARERIQFLQTALSTEAQISFMMVTAPISSGGLVPGRTQRDYETAPVNEALGDLSVIHVDGRFYLAGSPEKTIAVSLQDQAGTINLNALNRDSLDRLFNHLGIEPRYNQSLEARMIDYRDSDDLESLDGAEIRAYGSSGLANRPFRQPDEFLSVLGMRELVTSRKWRELRQHLSADSLQGSFNVNSATPEALKIILNLNEDQVRALVQAREISPFLSTQDIDAVIGPSVLWNEDSFYTFPYSALYVTVYDKSSQWYYRSRLALTPSGLERPLWVDQTEIAEAPMRAKPDTSNAPRLPYAPY